jgi:hypothetical protein
MRRTGRPGAQREGEGRSGAGARSTARSPPVPARGGGAPAGPPTACRTRLSGRSDRRLRLAPALLPHPAAMPASSVLRSPPPRGGAAVLAGRPAASRTPERAHARRPVAVPAHPAAAAQFAATPADRAALVQRGAHVVATRGCTDCHGAPSAARWWWTDPPPAPRRPQPHRRRPRPRPRRPRWSCPAPRRAARRRPLVVMPSTDYAAMSDEDVAGGGLRARAAPAVRTQPPALRLGPCCAAPSRGQRTSSRRTPRGAARVAGRARGPRRRGATRDSGLRGRHLHGLPRATSPAGRSRARRPTGRPRAHHARPTPRRHRAVDRGRLRAAARVRRPPRRPRVDTVHMPVRMTRR